MKKQKSKQKQGVPSVNFWKIFLFFLVFFFLLILILRSNIFRDSMQNSRNVIENLAFSKAQTLCQILEDTWMVQKVEQLKSLTFSLYNAGPNTRRLLERWLEEKQDFVSLTFYLGNGQESIRSIQRSLWNEKEVVNLSKEDRQALFAYLFGKPDFSIVKSGWSAGEVFSGQILGYPIVSVLIDFRNAEGRHWLEAKFKIDPVQTLVTPNISSGEKIVITDAARHTIMQFPLDEDKPDLLTGNTGLHWAENGLTVSIPFVHLPWKLNLYKKMELATGKTSWFQENTIVFIGGGFALVLILSLILYRWIDLPIQRLIGYVTEVGRGKFYNRIPDQKNRNMQKLSRIFNYMAEEMDHLQNINVSEIINEKIKTESIIRNIADGLIVTDSKDRILVVNSVAEKWFHLKEKEVVHKLLRDILKIEPLTLLTQKVKEGQEKSTEEFNYRVIGDRRERTFQAHGSRVKGSKNKFIGIVTVIRDVTKEREADRLKTDLVSMVAHELKSPLTSIFGFSELLLESNLKDPQTKEYAQVIQTESSRLTELINKFLDLSKLEAGRTEVRMSPFDLKQVINRVIEINQAQTNKKEIRVITDIPENCTFAFGDQDMIEQVLQNLFNNALKYSPNRSKIGIEVKESESELVVNVIDNGYGIPKEFLPNIFDKFFRVVDSNEYNDVEGSGLGLALSKEIIERHGGTISAKSRLGVGSVFTFTLPKSNITLSDQAAA